MIEQARTVASVLDDNRHCFVAIGVVELFGGSAELYDGRKDRIEGRVDLRSEILGQSTYEMARFA